MKQFVVTSNSFNGQILYEYDAEDLFHSIRINASLTAMQIRGLTKNIPLILNELLAMPQSYPGMAINQVPIDLSFENFWIVYNYPKGKKAAAKAWERLTIEQKTLAILKVSADNRELAKTGVAKLYPATYLNQERFNDKFN